MGFAELIGGKKKVFICEQHHHVLNFWQRFKDLQPYVLTFDHHTNLQQAFQNELCNGNKQHKYVSVIDVLNHMLEVCLELTVRNTTSPEFNQLALNIHNFKNFTISSFNIDEATLATPREAYLTELIKIGTTLIEFYTDPVQMNWTINNTDFNKMNKITKNNPEAFYC